jgi:hypothetical protein
MTQHRSLGTHSSAPCLVATYWRTVVVCSKQDAQHGHGGMYPRHEWFHAMDPDSYPRPPGHELPLCRNRACMNYYRRPGAVGCVYQPGWMHPMCWGWEAAF